MDTSIVFPHRLGPPYKRALRNLMADYLKKIIQDSGELWKIFLLDLALAKELLLNDKRTVNPLLSPPGSLFISNTFKGGGGLIETTDLFNLAKTMVLVLHKELELDCERFLIFLWRYPVICIILTFRSRRWKSCAQQKRVHLVEKPSWTSPHEVLQSWLVNTVKHLLVKNDKGDGGGGLEREGGLLTFFPWKGGLPWEGWLNRGFTVSLVTKIYVC